MEDIKIYTTEEAAEILKCSKDYIRDRVEDGSLGHYRLGKRLRFTMDQLREFLDSRKVSVNCEKGPE